MGNIFSHLPTKQGKLGEKIMFLEDAIRILRYRRNPLDCFMTNAKSEPLNGKKLYKILVEKYTQEEMAIRCLVELAEEVTGCLRASGIKYRIRFKHSHRKDGK